MLDVVSSLVVWGGLRIARVPPDRVREIATPHHPPAAFTLVVLVGVVGIKEWLYRRLARIGRATLSTALRVDAWHR